MLIASYPKWYYYSKGKSDLDWILHHMNKIPDERKEAVSAEYERLYQTEKSVREKRKAANTYLKLEADKYE